MVLSTMLQPQALDTPLRPCPICSSTQFHQLTVSEPEQKVRLSICKQCQHEFINPLPLSSKEVDRYYQETQDDEETEYMEDPLRAPDFLINQKILQQANQPSTNQPPTNQQLKLLDFGCGKGQFTHFAQKSGFEAYGFDLAKELVAIGQKRNLSLHTGDFSTFAKKHGPFDIVHSDQVFEHLADPTQILNKIKKALKPTGLLCLSVPLRDSFMHEYRFMEHLSYFSESSLKYLLEENGFSIFHTRKGIPLIRRYHRTIGKLPPLAWVQFWEKLTSFFGIYGWSIVMFARPKSGERTS